MILAFSLVLPLPRNVRKGVLLFTSKVLSFPILGGIKFAHFALILSGVPLLDSTLRTYKSAAEAVDHDLTPNQRIGVLARKWREERNFWIAAMAFTLWCLLTVLYAQVGKAMRTQDELDRLQAELDDIKGIKRPAAPKIGGMKVPGVEGVTKLLNMGKKEEDQASDAVNATQQAETELSPAGFGAGPTGAAARRRAAPAAAGAASMQ
eukprot:GHRR01012873.1.p1 GENE.GHRR01012873.1~~GHRR01012873.1.p1  ORF type:complete len:207 (+),score=65.45 GHRR01012873.1:297-917(+)